MTINIEKITLWEDNPKATNNVPLVRIDFKFPCKWTVLNLEDLKNLLERWIDGEERVYPIIKTGRESCHLYQFIEEIFIKKLGWTKNAEGQYDGGVKA
jgi:hypothetical protein